MKNNGINFSNPEPLYEQIISDIRNRIERGELKPGDQIDSQKELSLLYKVSLITVKKAISTLVNEGILFARAGRGTYISEKPEKKIDLVNNNAIGLVLTDLKHPYFSLMIQYVEQRASELGFHLLLSSSSGDIEKEETQIKKFRQLGVDGLIIASLSFKYKALDYIRRIHDENFPYIMVSYIHDPEYWYVGSDQEYGGYIATEHLIKTGYKSIGYVHVGKGNLLSEVRKNGYYRALAENDIHYNSSLVFGLGMDVNDTGKDRLQLGYEFGQQFKSFDKKPDALFFYNDMIALGFIKAALEFGIKVPDDVAVVGYDDVPLAQFSAVPLTTIHQFPDKAGITAVDIIRKRIDKNDIGNRTIFKPTLIIRDSCGAKKKAHIDGATAA